MHYTRLIDLWPLGQLSDWFAAWSTIHEGDWFDISFNGSDQHLGRTYPNVFEQMSTHPNIFKHIQKYSNISEHVQTYQNTSKHIQTLFCYLTNILDAHIQTNSNRCQHIQTYSKIFKHLWTYPNTSKHIQTLFCYLLKDMLETIQVKVYVSS